MSDIGSNILKSVSRIIRKAIYWIQKNPYLLILIGILTIISLKNIKFEYSLLGWDNYSSFLNINSNLVRSFFSTWREYRGLGVVSDSEVVDIWRNIYYFFGQIFFSTNILEQLYYLFSLNLGVVMLYKLANYIFKSLEKSSNLYHFADLFSFIASIFYLFNMNTLSVFYFPMLMFVARFYALPTIIYIFLQFFISNNLGTKKTLLYIILLFISSITFIVPTIFITILLVVASIIISYRRHISKSLVVFIVFMGINMYWLLPFINYTIQKSDDIKLASTFVRMNEDLLNKNASYYKPERSIALIPQFFDMRFVDSQKGSVEVYHPLFKYIDESSVSIEKYLIWVFPALYIVGSVILLFQSIRKPKFLWIPIVVFTFVFLSMNEFGPMGFLYSFLARQIPLFEVVFRFGDTKFHSIIAFAGSLAASYTLIFIIYQLRKYLPRFSIRTFSIAITVILLTANIYLFRTYFSRQLIGFFMYNKIPDAYYQISLKINQDSRYGRVLHLPIDKTGYWKSYSWGYVGSAFLQYMLNKPLIDKTFEPASIENWAVIEKINSLQTNIQSILDKGEQRKRAVEMYGLLQKVGVRYIILDGTISARVLSRGIDVWNTTNYPNADTIVSILENSGYIKKINTYDIDLSNYDFYAMYPYLKSNNSNEVNKITLYEVKDIEPQIKFLPKATDTSDTKWELLLRNGSSELGHTIQRNLKNALYFPFFRNTSDFKLDGKHMKVSTSVTGKMDGKYDLRIVDKDSLPNPDYLIEIYAVRVGNKLDIQLNRVAAPIINKIDQNDPIGQIRFIVDNKEFEKGESRSSTDFINSLRRVNSNIVGHYRLQVGNKILPIPANIDSKPFFVGAVMIDDQDLNVTLLERNNRIKLDAGGFTVLPNESCYKDQLAEFTHDTVVPSQSEITIATRNGSSCVISRVIDLSKSPDSIYAELHFTGYGGNKDLDENYKYGTNNLSTKPLLQKTVQKLQKISYLSGCIRERDFGNCQIASGINLGLNRKYIVPLNKNISAMQSPVVYFEIRPSAYQEVAATLQEIYVDLYKLSASTTIRIPKIQFKNSIIFSDQDIINSSFPIDVSRDSYYSSFPNDILTYNNIPASDYATVRVMSGNKIVSFVDNSAIIFYSHLPFSSDNMYIWTIDYNLGSGQYPFFGIEDDFRLVKYDQISMWQGYPSIKGFKLFQSPEYFANIENIERTLTRLNFAQASKIISPEKELLDIKDKYFKIAQSTENEGLIVIDNTNIVRVPNYWGNLALIPKKGSVSKYLMPVNSLYNRILPSLMKVNIKTDNPGRLMLKFNEGYDKQWGIYEGILNMIFGKSESQSIRCDGYANCFEIEAKKGSASFYIFFWPEKLAIIGWISTFISAIVFIFFGRKKKLHA